VIDHHYLDRPSLWLQLHTKLFPQRREDIWPTIRRVYGSRTRSCMRWVPASVLLLAFQWNGESCGDLSMY